MIPGSSGTAGPGWRLSSEAHLNRFAHRFHRFQVERDFDGGLVADQSIGHSP
jgi:hypothetical protein